MTITVEDAACVFTSEVTSSQGLHGDLVTPAGPPVHFSWFVLLIKPTPPRGPWGKALTVASLVFPVPCSNSSVDSTNPNTTRPIPPAQNRSTFCRGIPRQAPTLHHRGLEFSALAAGSVFEVWIGRPGGGPLPRRGSSQGSHTTTRSLRLDFKKAVPVRPSVRVWPLQDKGLTASLSEAWPPASS